MPTALRLVENNAPRHPAKKPDARAQTLRAIHATWRKVCPLDGEELRDARLVFATNALGLKKSLTSTSKLSQSQLGRILDKMRELERAPVLPGVEGVCTAVSARPSRLPGGEGEVHHLATDAQVGAINKLIHHLGWSAIGAQAFIAQRYRRDSARLLTPAQANALTMILFNIAASKAIKSRPGFEGKVTRQMIRMEIPRLKQELGIDLKKFNAVDTEGEFNG